MGIEKLSPKKLLKPTKRIPPKPDTETIKQAKNIVDTEAKKVLDFTDYAERKDRGEVKTKRVKGKTKKLTKKISPTYKTTTNELVDKILKFCMVLTGIDLFIYQQRFAKRIIKSVLEDDSEEITALFSRQSGREIERSS